MASERVRRLGHGLDTGHVYGIQVTCARERQYVVAYEDNQCYTVGMARVLSRQASTAVKLLGSEIAQARRERRWSQEGLAERAGVSPVTVRAIEHGLPSVAIGTVLELAVLTGVPLFSQDTADLPRQLANSRDRLSLLPRRVRASARPVNDDF